MYKVCEHYFERLFNMREEKRPEIKARLRTSVRGFEKADQSIIGDEVHKALKNL